MDWFTSRRAWNVWGDGRLFILGTEGYIELRKYIDIAGEPGGNHLFMVDQKQIRYIDCSKVVLPFGPQFVSRHRQSDPYRTGPGTDPAGDGVGSERTEECQAAAFLNLDSGSARVQALSNCASRAESLIINHSLNQKPETLALAAML